MLGLATHYDILKGFPNREDTEVLISLNENPMYFDEDGNRNVEEPSYQIVIKVKDTTKKQSPILIYDYFESPTDEETQLFVLQLAKNIQSFGITNVNIA